MTTDRVRQAADNLRFAWTNTPPCEHRRELVLAIRYATEHDHEPLTEAEIEAVADRLSDLIKTEST